MTIQYSDDEAMVTWPIAEGLVIMASVPVIDQLKTDETAYFVPKTKQLAASLGIMAVEGGNVIPPLGPNSGMAERAVVISSKAMETLHNMALLAPTPAQDLVTVQWLAEVINEFSRICAAYLDRLMAKEQNGVTHSAG